MRPVAVYGFMHADPDEPVPQPLKTIVIEGISYTGCMGGYGNEAKQNPTLESKTLENNILEA